MVDRLAGRRCCGVCERVCGGGVNLCPAFQTTILFCHSVWHSVLPLSQCGNADRLGVKWQQVSLGQRQPVKRNGANPRQGWGLAVSIQAVFVGCAVSFSICNLLKTLQIGAGVGISYNPLLVPLSELLREGGSKSHIVCPSHFCWKGGLGDMVPEQRAD